MNHLALVIELHHPLPGPGEAVGHDWASAAVELYWPIIRALSRQAERAAESLVTLALSPCWTALAADPLAQADVRRALEARAGHSATVNELRQFVVEQWGDDPIRALRRLDETGVVELIPTTASPTWLPSIASEPVLARAQVALAVADHSRRFGSAPDGIWLPFRSYLPGLESVMAGSGLRYFGVAAEALLRGTVLPPEREFGIVVTPPGVAALGVSPVPTQRLLDHGRHYARDPRYADASRVAEAAADHAEHFVANWLRFADTAPRAAHSTPICIAALSAHEFAGWPRGPAWLDEVLSRMPGLADWKPTTLGRFVDRFGEGVLGRPGPATGGLLSVRPGGSDLLDRCRLASESLASFVELRQSLDRLGRRALAQLTRSLLLAQALDWELPPGLGIGAERGLKRADRHLARFNELAGLLAAGRVDSARLAEHEAGITYLPDIEIELLART